METGGYALDLAEPYLGDDGTPSVALIWNGHANYLTVRELKSHPELSEAGEYLEGVFFSSPRHLWRYPSKPVVPEGHDDIRRLHIDLQRCSDQYIEFPDSAWPSVFATWIMGSYLVPFIDRSPLLLIFGPSESGKGQVLDQVDRLAYRGTKMISPTPAVLYRWADEWEPTFALDELQDSDKESFRAIMTIVKGAYDGTPVYRCESKTHKVDAFQTRSFIALSLKGSHPAEDITNRGILFTMRRNEHPKTIVPWDSPEHKDLRARLVGLRLKLLADMNFLEGALKEVQERGTPEALGFDRRPRDIALSLLLPAILSGQEDELIEAIGKSNAEAKDADNSTFIALVQRCLEKKWVNYTDMQFISVLGVRDEVGSELIGDGELKPNDKLPTRRVTNALKTLGYETVRRTGNNPFIDTWSKHNLAAFETNKKRYPLVREGAE